MRAAGAALAPAEIECVEEGRRAAALLQHPLRLRILRQAAEPASASAIAEKLGLPRQQVNYHLRELARARFVRRAGDRKKRNMVERRFVATARSYVLAPEGLLSVETAARRSLADRASAGYLVTLASRVLREAARAAAEAARSKKRFATLAIEAEVRFESAEQRARFARELESAVADVVARHASPATLDSGAAAPGRPFRLAVTCHPIPSSENEKRG